MTQTFQLNSNNDLFLNPEGNLTVLTGRQAVAAACETATQTQLGECVLQTGYGLPNFSLIWTGVPDYALWQSYLQQILLSVPGVENVLSVRISVQNHVLTYNAQITTIYDPQPILIQGNISTTS